MLLIHSERDRKEGEAMKYFLAILLLFVLCSCASRTKVLSNKTTGERWISVDNPKEFLSKEEQRFFNLK